jgi:hypothetical protein
VWIWWFLLVLDEGCGSGGLRREAVWPMACGSPERRNEEEKRNEEREKKIKIK